MNIENKIIGVQIRDPVSGTIYPIHLHPHVSTIIGGGEVFQSETIGHFSLAVYSIVPTFPFEDQEGLYQLHNSLQSELMGVMLPLEQLTPLLYQQITSSNGVQPIHLDGDLEMVLTQYGLYLSSLISSGYTWYSNANESLANGIKYDGTKRLEIHGIPKQGAPIHLQIEPLVQYTYINHLDLSLQPDDEITSLNIPGRWNEDRFLGNERIEVIVNYTNRYVFDATWLTKKRAGSLYDHLNNHLPMHEIMNGMGQQQYKRAMEDLAKMSGRILAKYSS